MKTTSKLPVFLWIALLSCFSLCADMAKEELVRIRGGEAEDAVRITVDVLAQMKSFALKIRKTRTSEFFEPVKTESEILWKEPMFLKWTERNPVTKKTESVSLLTPERYIHFVKGLNTVEILDMKKHKDIRKKFDSYMKMISGGYREVKGRYTFLVYRVKGADKPEKKSGSIREPEKEQPAEKKHGKQELAEEKSKENEKKKKDILRLWKEQCAAFRKTYGSHPSEYRIKFKPRTKELKKEITHINIVLNKRTIIGRVITVRADGDIIQSDIAALSDINSDIPESAFAFDIPPDAQVKYLLEDK